MQSQLGVVKFKIIAPPLYKCEVEILDKERGKQKIELATRVIKESIEASGGSYKEVT